jgi:hypothetical protein
VPVSISAASAQMAARHLLNRKTGLLANFRCGSFASVWPDRGDFRSTMVNGHSQDRRACLKGAMCGQSMGVTLSRQRLC